MLGNQVKIGWSGQPPFHRQEKNQTSENVSVLLCHLVLCDVVSLSMTLSCLPNLTVLVNTVSLHQVLYMIAVVIVWNASATAG